MTQEKIKRPVRQRRREAHERPSAEERPTDPGVSRSSIAITNRPRGTLLTRKYIEKGRFWEPSFWAMVCCRKHTEGVHHELNNRADKLRDRCLSRIFSAAPANHSPGSLLSFLISAGIAGSPLSYDLHSGDSAGAPQRRVCDLQVEVKPPCVPASSLQTRHSDGSSGEPGWRWLLERSRTFLTS